ncbi:PHP domain-containing protein [uncultured Methylophaga sp.]|uniref:PHP domain-containing protein n=1 Tax=uncultured Methylophaga sp. TaxID=285271 RepID=UPI0026331520|nr:PHP domain-containing protein [uncultured Methylophaga sp.]
MTHYDLHCHSTASDGALSPKALVERAVQQGVDVLALTDHDGTEGIKAALEAATEQPLILIPGVEISVSWNSSTVHIVGLNIDIENAKLQNGLANIRQYRQQRAEQIAQRLEKSGISGALEGAGKYASKTMLGRMHFAQFLVEQGHASNAKDVFKRFLVRGKPGYVPGQWTDLESAVEWIIEAGGQAVIAHPLRYKMTGTKLRRLIDDFKTAGGQAIEVSSGHQHPDQLRNVAALAKHYELLASCGSDFHGPEQTWSELGRFLPLPASCKPVWSLWQ